MNKNPLISIIIPVFNTRAFIRECVESIRRQSYTNLEIILVDDGSNDDSFSICKESEKLDKRVVVLRKKNGGVSSARNLGIKSSKGKYIAFVDSDDIIANDFIETLYNLIIKQSSDVSICNFSTFKKDENNTSFPVKKTLTLLGKQNAIESLLYQKQIQNSVCAKLYKRELIKKPYFDKNISYGEDLLFNYKVLTLSKKVIISSDIKYFYRQRPGSAMNSNFKRDMMSSLDAAFIINNDSGENHHNLIKATELKLFIEALVLILKIPTDSQVFADEYKRCLGVIVDNRRSVILNSQAKIAHRCYALLSIISIRFLKSSLLTKNSLKGLF
jgi:glycosyltransferase involved in cell wall biosynthesis